MISVYNIVSALGFCRISISPHPSRITLDEALECKINHQLMIASTVVMGTTSTNTTVVTPAIEFPTQGKKTGIFIQFSFPTPNKTYNNEIIIIQIQCLPMLSVQIPSTTLFHKSPLSSHIKRELSPYHIKLPSPFLSLEIYHLPFPPPLPTP